MNILIDGSQVIGIGGAYTPTGTQEIKIIDDSDFNGERKIELYWTGTTIAKKTTSMLLEEKKDEVEKLIDIKTHNDIVNNSYSYNGELFSTSLIAQGNWASINQQVKNNKITFPKKYNTQNRKQYTFVDLTDWETFIDGYFFSIESKWINAGNLKISLDNISTLAEIETFKNENGL